MIALREASGVSDIGAIALREAAGVGDVGAILLREGGGLTAVYAQGGGSGAFTVDVPPNVYGYGSSLSSIAITTSIATATPTGGTAPFTYVWSGAAAGWTITNPTSQSTAVRANSVPPADGVSTSISCTVTDANGDDVTSSSVSAEVFNFGGYE